MQNNRFLVLMQIKDVENSITQIISIVKYISTQLWVFGRLPLIVDMPVVLRVHLKYKAGVPPHCAHYPPLLPLHSGQRAASFNLINEASSAFLPLVLEQRRYSREKLKFNGLFSFLSATVSESISGSSFLFFFLM